MTGTPASPAPSPPLKYHGGKNYLASRIIKLMPPHTHYVEPYAGGLAVLLAKDPTGVSEVINDRNGWLTTFWNVLRHPVRFEQFRRMAEATPFSQRMWESATALRAAKPDVRQHGPVKAALIFLVLCRQSRAGQMESFAPLSRNRTRRGMNEQASAWLTAVEGLPAVHERLKRVVVLNAPAVDVIRQQDGAKTLFYLDPPYHPATRTSPEAYGEFDMTHEDHVEFLHTVRSCTGKVMISGYDCDVYRRKLAGWARHEFDLPNNAAGGVKKARMTEVVWCNF